MGLCDSCKFKKQQNIMVFCTNENNRYDKNRKQCDGYKGEEYGKINKEIRRK